MSVTSDFYLARVASCDREAGKAAPKTISARWSGPDKVWRLLAERFFSAAAYPPLKAAYQVAVGISHV